MTFWRHLPIKRKLSLVILLASLATLVLTSATLLAFQWFYARRVMIRDLETQAEILAANSTAALSFGDAQVATEILSALKAKRHMLSAALYAPDQQRLATVARAGVVPDPPRNDWPDGFHYEGPHLLLAKPVLIEKRRIGTLRLRFDAKAIQRETIMPYFAVFGLILPAAALLGLFLSSLLQRVISRPILALAATAKAVAEQKDFSVRAPGQGRDELGLLTNAFNQMLARIQEDDSTLRRINHNLEQEIAHRQRAQTELERVHREMLEVSRQAGMAEVATGVLHNVGNVLNSVNVSASLVIDRLKHSRLANLPKLAQMLQQNSGRLGEFLTADPKGQHLPGYLISLSDVVRDDQVFVLKELDALHAHLDHIKEIVAMQQNYARVSGIAEIVALPEVVEDALKLNAGALVRHGVQVRREFEPVPPLLLEKHKVLQILINLIRNAKYALEESGRPDRWMTLVIARNGGQRLKIQVRDNGVGIPAENLTRIFAHGFTTRKNGHGFGLHSGALAAKELGGSLLAHSDGLGCGATFTLELPLEPAHAP